MDVTTLSLFFCALAYLGLAALLSLHSERSAPVVALVIACVLTGLWALASALEARLATDFFDDAHAVAWVVFLGIAYRSGMHESGFVRGFRWAASSAAGIGLWLIALDFAPVYETKSAHSIFMMSLYGRIALCVGGLVLVEALLRQARTDGSWRIRYLCLGVGGMIGFDLFRVSEALLFQRHEPTLDVSRGAVFLIAAPLIAVAAARNSKWSAELNVARRAVFHAATIYAIALYLLALAALGAALPKFDSEWGRVLQAALFFVALLTLVGIWFSPTARSRLKKQFISYFFTHRHDYREQWIRFADALSSPNLEGDLRDRASEALADVVESPGGGLWIRESDLLIPVVGGPPSDVSAELSADAPFVQQLEMQAGRILEFGLDETGLRRAAWLPEWLREWQDAWLIVPLVHAEHMIGFVVLCRGPGQKPLDHEDEDLLLAVARHVSSYLAADQSTRTLEESRRFEELSRGMAFIAHDLRNLANEMALTLSNARKHLQNPEFQRDMLLSMEDSVAGMQRLLDRIRGRAQDVRHESTDFVDLIQTSIRRHTGSGSTVEFEVDRDSPLPVACDTDRLVSMSGHLIQNAIDAAGPDGHVTIRLRRDGDRSLFEVEDDGAGMTPDFLRERLLHPFRSSKRKGFGLGLYECRQLARALGGALAIDSQPGEGTVARLWLPLAVGVADSSEGEDSDVDG